MLDDVHAFGSMDTSLLDFAGKKSKILIELTLGFPNGLRLSFYSSV